MRRDRKQYNHWFIVSLLGLLLLVGCGSNNMSNYVPKALPTAQETESTESDIANVSAESNIANAPKESDSTNTQMPEAQVQETQTALVEGINPEPDMVSVVGRAVDEATGEPIADYAVRLIDVVWDDAHENAYTVFNDTQNPGVMTDEQGFFVFENIPDKEHVMFFSQYGGIDEDVVFVLDPDKVDTGQIFDFEVGEVTDLGVLEIRRPAGKF